MFVNLLPANTRLKIQFRSMIRGYAVFWGLGGLLMAAYVLVQTVQLWQANCELVLLEKRCQPIYALQRKIARDQQQLQLVEAQLDQLTELQPSNHFVDLLGVLVEATRAELGRLRIQRLSLLSGQVATASPGAAKSSAAQPTLSTLSLSGIAEDDASVTQFITSLRASGVFQQVDLKSSSQIGGESRDARQYQLECRYQDVP